MKTILPFFPYLSIFIYYTSLQSYCSCWSTLLLYAPYLPCLPYLVLSCIAPRSLVSTHTHPPPTPINHPPPLLYPLSFITTTQPLPNLHTSSLSSSSPSHFLYFLSFSYSPAALFLPLFTLSHSLLPFRSHCPSRCPCSSS